MNTTHTILDSLQAALLDAGRFNKGAQTKPSAVLWTDADGQWFPALLLLQSAGFPVFSLGRYDAAACRGPAIWLKCAVAGAIEGLPVSDTTPVIYLPGVSRADLRAIESCPRELQPLAELQYRGVFWSQANAKDWTVNAFLASKNGGLGLDVAQDKATQDAIVSALKDGVFFHRMVEELQGRLIDAPWLDSLLAPNHTRDILVWLNDPTTAKAQWSDARWDVFAKRCKKDFGIVTESDGPLAAAERLAARQSNWATVWELYADSYTSFPAVEGLLAKVQPPQSKGLFDDPNEVAGYPRANHEAEAALRTQLNGCAAMTPEQVRVAITDAEKEHGCRRDWLWARMGFAPLAQALKHLAEVAVFSAQLPGGASVAQMAVKYRESGWRVDAAALSALAAVQAKVDADAVGIALRVLYVPWLEETARRFQELVKAEGGLGPQLPGAGVGPMAGDTQADGVCTVFVDGLRYDVAMRLKERLTSLGTVEVTAGWTSMPSVTASGKAWVSPVAALVSGSKEDIDFQPDVASSGKPLSAQNFRKLLADQGFQVLDKHQSGEHGGRAWVECGDLDHYGHEHGLRLAGDLESQLRQIVERLAELRDAGWRRFRIVTDHGWLLVPGGLPKTQLSKFEAETRWGRCAVLKDSSHGTPLTFGWDWCKDVQLAFAPGISSFIAGAEYAHGGLTLQECLVPVLDVQVDGVGKVAANVVINSATWKRMRCTVEVTPGISGLSVDIRTKAAQASSSLLNKVKPVEGGKTSVFVEDDEHIGTAAVVVVLDASGTVVQKASTMVGG